MSRVYPIYTILALVLILAMMGISTAAPISCYSYDTNANDEIGSNNPTANTAAHTATAKLGGGSYYFDLDSTYIQYPDFVNGAFSACWWAYVASVPSVPPRDQVLMLSQGNQYDIHIYIGASDNITTTHSNYIDSISGSLISWRHYCYTYDGATTHWVSVDADITSGDFSVSESTSAIQVGGGLGGNHTIIGTIDELRFWDYAINQSEIEDDYNSGSGRTCSYYITPTTPAITINSTIKVNQTLVANCSNSTGSTYYYEFYNTNHTATVQAYSTNASFLLNTTNAHDKIRVRCKASNGATNSSEAEANITVSNTNLTTSTNVSVNASILVGQLFTANCSGSTDADNDTITYYYGVYYQEHGLVCIDGICPDYSLIQSFSTNNTLLVNSSLAHDNIKFGCKATDGTVNTTQINSSIITVSDTLPTTPTNLTLNATIKVNQTLTANCSGSTDADSDTITYYYEFYNNNDTATLQNYSTTATYNITNSSAHDSVRVRCKARTSYGNSTGEKEENITVSNTAPVATVAILGKPLNITQNMTINITYSDIDGDTWTANETSWYNDTVLMADLANETTILSGNFSINDAWTVSVRVNDSYEWSEYANDSLWFNDTNPPVATSYSASTYTPYTDQDVTFTVNVTDDYGLPVTACDWYFIKSDFDGGSGVGIEFSKTTNTWATNETLTFDWYMMALGPGTLQMTRINCTDYSGNSANYTLGQNISISVRPGGITTPPAGGGSVTNNYYNSTDNAPKSLPTGFFNGVLVAPIYGQFWLTPFTIMCIIAAYWLLSKSRKKVKVI